MMTRSNLFRNLLWSAIAFGALCGLALALIPPRPGAADTKLLPPVGQDGRQVSPAHGIWCGLLLASREKEPQPLPAFLEPFEKRMKKRFGFNQFLLVDETIEPLAGDGSRWFAPSQKLSLQVRILQREPAPDAAPQDESGEQNVGQVSEVPSKINFKIFQDERPIIDADAQMSYGKPLFIRGPVQGEGQLIFVLITR